MVNPSVTEKQAYLVAISLLSGEKTKNDYGHAATSESLKIIKNKLEMMEEREKLEKALSTKNELYNKYNI